MTIVSIINGKDVITSDDAADDKNTKLSRLDASKQDQGKQDPGNPSNEFKSFYSFNNLGLNFEYSSSEAREILQPLFPKRSLVLSQFTFFNQVGIAKPTGETKKKGRRCYRLVDLLSIATVLALKEEGVPYKNIQSVPRLIQAVSKKIFNIGPGSRLSGFGTEVGLVLGNQAEERRSQISVVSSNNDSTSQSSPSNMFSDENISYSELKELGLGRNVLENYLAQPSSSSTFWSIDLGQIAYNLQIIAVELAAENDAVQANSGLVA